MEVQEGNKLIAEFMGMNGFPKYKELDWSLIMPAIQKAVRIIKKNGWEPDEIFGYVPVADLYELPIYAPVKKARNKLIAFIQFYITHSLPNQGRGK